MERYTPKTNPERYEDLLKQIRLNDIAEELVRKGENYNLMVRTTQGPVEIKARYLQGDEHPTIIFHVQAEHLGVPITIEGCKGRIGLANKGEGEEWYKAGYLGIGGKVISIRGIKRALPYLAETIEDWYDEIAYGVHQKVVKGRYSVMIDSGIKEELEEKVRQMQTNQ